jgi:hypothetical protein
VGPSSRSFESEKCSFKSGQRQQEKQTEMYLPFPQGPLATEVSKAVAKIRLVAGAFEAECGTEVDQHRFVHIVAVFAKIFSSI